MDNLEIGQWPLNVSRVSLLRFVLLINMLISGVVIKMFYLGKGGGERKEGPKLLLDQRTTPSSSLKVTRGKKKKRRQGKEQETKKIINQFARKSDPALNPFSPGGGGVADTLVPPSRSTAESSRVFSFLWTYSPLTSD